MPDYRLEGLSTRSFEQLVQALAQKHFGARTLIFGDGADGAREAAFVGEATICPSGEKWNGHMIVQAKFLQLPKTAAKENTDWLKVQIEKEMKKFAPRGSRSKKLVPASEYYVIATNVRNSGVAKVGGKDRIRTLLEQYKKKLRWNLPQRHAAPLSLGGRLFHSGDDGGGGRGDWETGSDLPPLRHGRLCRPHPSTARSSVRAARLCRERTRARRPWRRRE